MRCAKHFNSIYDIKNDNIMFSIISYTPGVLEEDSNHTKSKKAAEATGFAAALFSLTPTLC